MTSLLSLPLLSPAWPLTHPRPARSSSSVFRRPRTASTEEDKVVTEWAPAPREGSVYEAELLAGPKWAQELDLAQVLGDERAGAGYGHSYIKDHYGHTGCVNALDWDEGGNTLASGGDDTKICIWTPSSSLLDSEPLEEGVPPVHLALSAAIETGHTQNIFNVKWAPGKAERVVSCAGDREIRVFDLQSSLSTNVTGSSGGQQWSHYATSSALRTVRSCHRGRVKRLLFPSSSADQFLSCSEDGTVRSHDLREAHRCIQGGCQNAIVKYHSRMSLYSLSCSSLRPWLFVVAGTSPYAYMHDRRMLSAVSSTWGSSISHDASDEPPCVRRFGPPVSSAEAGSRSRPSSREHVVATRMGERNPRELLVSFSGGPVCLFDTDGETEQEQELASGGKTKAKKGGRAAEEQDGSSSLLGTEEDGDKKKRKRSTSSSLTSAQQSQAVETKRTKSASSASASASADEFLALVDASEPEVAAETRRMLEAALEQGSDEEEGEEDGSSDEDELEEDMDMSSESGGDDSEDDEDEDEYFSALGRFEHHSSAPIVRPLRSYEGHSNSQTIKDVAFGAREEKVVTGSDDGNWFAYDKATGELEGIWAGDQSVVNVVEEHPRLPVVVVSGIDTTVKVFGRTHRKFLKRMRQLSTTTTEEEQEEENRKGKTMSRMEQKGEIVRNNLDPSPHRGSSLGFALSVVMRQGGPALVAVGPDGEPMLNEDGQPMLMEPGECAIA